MKETITRMTGGKLVMRVMVNGVLLCGRCGRRGAVVAYCRAFGGLEERELRCRCGNIITIETKEERPCALAKDASSGSRDVTASAGLMENGPPGSGR